MTTTLAEEGGRVEPCTSEPLAAGGENHSEPLAAKTTASLCLAAVYYY